MAENVCTAFPKADLNPNESLRIEHGSIERPLQSA